MGSIQNFHLKNVLPKLGAFLLILISINVAFAAPGEDSQARLSVIYAPDIVAVGRLFMVSLKGAANPAGITVEMPPGIKPVYRSRKKDHKGAYKFFFRAALPLQEAKIVFRDSDRRAVVPITAWSFEDLCAFRTLKGMQLPRRWPLGERLPELKQKQTVNWPKGVKARDKRVHRAQAWLARSDDDIWAMQPDSTIPRWHWVNLSEGCPVHGQEIYHQRAFYPWEIPLSQPWKWKIVCPVGGEAYPSNDFASGDMDHGPFPDDGLSGGCLYKNNKFNFVARIAQAYCHQMLRVAPECARAYLATGDRDYAHKALVALSRLAVEYAYLATMTQHRHRNKVEHVRRYGPALFKAGPFLVGSGFTVYGINQPRYQWQHAEAYDQIFPVIDQDKEIIPFLRRKGLAVEDHEDLRRFIEENLFAVWMQGTIDHAFQSNGSFDQRGLARLAEILNYQRGRELVDWLYDGDGQLRSMLTNNFFRDGAPYEATGNYNGMHVAALGPLFDSLEHLKELRPALYPQAQYPELGKSLRYHNIYDFDMDSVTIDRSYPSIGDDGGFQDSQVFQALPKTTWQSGGAKSFEHAFRLFKDPKFAWALVHQPGWTPSADFPWSREEMEKISRQWPDQWNDRSALFDGYGIAVLRGGQGDDKRALWIRYGRARGHKHDDMMDIGLQAYQGVLLSHLGYPRNWSAWESNWITHNLARQLPRMEMTGQVDLFARAGPVEVVDITARAFRDRVDEGRGYTLPAHKWQRRLLALVEVDDRRFYALDWYRLSGGKEHWWSFHVKEGGLKIKDLQLTPQEGGTLAGPEVAYGDPGWLKKNHCTLGRYGWRGDLFGLAHFYNVQRGEHSGPWSADWRIKGGASPHLRLHMVDAQGMEVAVADGKSPAGGSPYEMKWVFLHKQGAIPLRSQVLSIIEPFEREPAIEKIEPLPLIKGKQDNFRGCRVHLDQRVDTILMATDPTTKQSLADGTHFAGRFGFWSRQEGRIKSMVLLGGTVLSHGGFALRLPAPAYHGRIVRWDPSANKIVVSPPPPEPQGMINQYIFVGDQRRKSAYKVKAVSLVNDDEVELQLGSDARIGTGRVSGFADHQIKTPTPFPLHGYRYYHGARLTNQAHTVEYRLLDVRDKTAAIIDPRHHSQAQADKLADEFPVDSWFQVYDFGVGDEVTWPYRASLREVGPGLYQVISSAPVEVTLPAECALQ